MSVVNSLPKLLISFLCCLLVFEHSCRTPTVPFSTVRENLKVPVVLPEIFTSGPVLFSLFYLFLSENSSFDCVTVIHFCDELRTHKTKELVSLIQGTIFPVLLLNSSWNTNSFYYCIIPYMFIKFTVIYRFVKIISESLRRPLETLCYFSSLKASTKKLKSLTPFQLRVFNFSSLKLWSKWVVCGFLFLVHSRMSA